MYKYKVIDTFADAEEQEKILNKQAKLGWEFMSAIHGDEEIFLYFRKSAD